MAGSGEQESVDDRSDRSNDGGFYEASVSEASSLSEISAQNSYERSVGVPRDQEAVEDEFRLTNRLTDILLNDGDGDLLLQGSDRDDRFLHWLQALDMQVLGACRADERLRPLLKMNVSSGMPEDCLLAHLSQYFEPLEVGVLARCFCIPLVSLRAGKINKRGILMCPTDARGCLSLTLLPTSDLRLSFIGDNGQTERIFTFSSRAQCCAVTIHDIPADNSGRSFVIKTPDGRSLYYWCCEKSKLLGIELLSKMKDLIKRKPSIAELTGINEARLGCFASHFRLFLMGSAIGQNSMGAKSMPLDTPALRNLSDTASTPVKSVRSRHSSNQPLKSNPFHQGSLSPRSSSFKEGAPRNSPSRIVRDKLRRLGDSQLSVIESTGLSASANTHSLSLTDTEKTPDVKSVPIASCSAETQLKYTGMFGSSLETQLCSIGPPALAPHYCWCTPSESALLQSTTQSRSSLMDLPSMPPFSSTVAAVASSMPMMYESSSIELADVPPLSLSPLLQDPLLCLPISNSQSIPTFTPLMCDPIVHIPYIDVCSSGQGYLVSAGPGISASIPSLHHSKFVNPVLPENDSLVEKGARETLRLLISGSSQAASNALSPLGEVFPSVGVKVEESIATRVTGSRGLYSGSIDVDSFVASTIPVVSVAMAIPAQNGARTDMQSGTLSGPRTREEEWSGSIDPIEKSGV